mgnify:CR=1 FL=1
MPLIIVKNSNRDRRRTWREDMGKRSIDIGMARVALRTKVTGEKKLDARGKPFKWSNEMAQGHSSKTLERWSKGRRTIAVGFGKFS